MQHRMGLDVASSGVPTPAQMATILPIGKARVLTINANMSDSSLDTALPMTATTNQPSKLKVRVNPDNPREVGVLALAATSGASVTATVNSDKFVQVTFQVPAPTLSSVTVGSDSGEIDPPAWLTA